MTAKASTNSSTAGAGIGFNGALLLVFLVLKLTHYIDWSWWWVMAPVWIPLCVALTVLGVMALVAAVKS